MTSFGLFCSWTSLLPSIPERGAGWINEEETSERGTTSESRSDFSQCCSDHRKGLELYESFPFLLSAFYVCTSLLRRIDRAATDSSVAPKELFSRLTTAVLTTTDRRLSTVAPC